MARVFIWSLISIPDTFLFGSADLLNLKVFAPRHRPLTTQLYPRPGQTEIGLDFVLVPE
ncbi:MAG: hypothetical protein HYS14_05625 [Candidatus Rokubacteria bacterium]|nr:hypothetical protein [Candidatus Rokubacteria bacterium]